MFMYNDPTSADQSQIDTSLVGLFVTAGGAACIEVDNGIITGATPNDPWKFLGLPSGSDPSDHLFDWIHADHRDQLSHKLEQVAVSGSPETLRLSFATPARPESTVTGYLLIVPGETASAFRLFLIPERHGNALDPEILRRHRLCNVGTLAAGISHDLNNLFTGILAVNDALHEAIDDPAVTRQLGLLETTVDRATELTDGLLAFVKDCPENISATDPLGSLAELAKLISATLGEHITFSMHLADESHPVKISRSHLGQVFLNLIINASDALKDTPGTIDVQASFHPPAAPTTFILSIADSGPGMTPSECEKVFRPFYTTKGSLEGTGLGLAIVKAIVEDAQGDIRIQSEPGRGTIFQVILPVDTDGRA